MKSRNSIDDNNNRKQRNARKYFTFIRGLPDELNYTT